MDCPVRHYFRTSFHASRSNGGVLDAGSHVARVLDSEMTQATAALERDEISRPRTRVAKRIEKRDSGAEQRRGLGGWLRPINLSRRSIHSSDQKRDSSPARWPARFAATMPATNRGRTQQ
jgi:hypothetical protein